MNSEKNPKSLMLTCPSVISGSILVACMSLLEPPEPRGPSSEVENSSSVAALLSWGWSQGAREKSYNCLYIRFRTFRIFLWPKTQFSHFRMGRGVCIVFSRKYLHFDLVTSQIREKKYFFANLTPKNKLCRKKKLCYPPTYVGPPS